MPAPPKPRADLRVLDSLEYASAAAARQAWNSPDTADDAGARAAKAQTAAVEPVQVDGHPVLKMPCVFVGNTLPRAVWDREIRVDLSRVSDIVFDVYIENLSAIGSFSLYFKSGDGWYNGRFFPDRERAWCRVRIRKADFGVEGTPAGWSRVERVRLSPWASAPRSDSLLYLANFGAIEPAAGVAVLRREIRGKDASEEKQKSIDTWVQSAAEMLDDAGIVPMVLGTSDLQAAGLRGLKVVVVPYAPGLEPDVIALLAEFVRGGGHIIACYDVPAALGDVLGVKLGACRKPKPGEFASMRFASTPPALAPQTVNQNSWIAVVATPIAGRSQVAAWWHSADGTRTDVPAIILSDAGAYISHVLTKDDQDAKRALLAGLIAAAYPEVRKTMFETRLMNVCTVVQQDDWPGAVHYVASLPGHGKTGKDALARAQGAYAIAQAKGASGDWDGALGALVDVRAALVESFCLSQQSVPNEFRAVWCHQPEGVAGMSWEESAALLARCGINQMIVNMLWAGSAGYPSAVLPYHTGYAEKRDYLAECIEACHKHGIKVHVWMVNWNAGPPGSYLPKDAFDRLRAEGRTQVDKTGKVTDWLCPSNDRNQKQVFDAMVEAARKPGVDGVHFDYIRYPGDETCFCPTCRVKFEAGLGAKVAQWPADVLSKGMHRDAWVQFRCDNITRVVKAVHDEVRRVAPGVQISAAVFSAYPQCRVNVGQDWKVWCEQGYLDFICPMDYTPTDMQFDGWVKSQLDAIQRRIPLYPGIGAFLMPGPVGTIRQIEIARGYQTGGWVIFAYGSTSAKDLFPWLPKGVTAPAR